MRLVGRLDSDARRCQAPTVNGVSSRFRIQGSERVRTLGYFHLAVHRLAVESDWLIRPMMSQGFERKAGLVHAAAVVVLIITVAG